MHVEGLVKGVCDSSKKPNLMALDGTTSLTSEAENTLLDDSKADPLSATAGVCIMRGTADYAILDDALVVVTVVGHSHECGLIRSVATGVCDAHDEDVPSNVAEGNV